MRPKLLDLFCGAGGASAGYARAGFDVTGVDNSPSVLRSYPFPSYCDDAMTVLTDAGYAAFLARFDVVHASPPCGEYSATRRTHTVSHPTLIDPVRATLQDWAGQTRIYVLENVEGAPMPGAITICGAQSRAVDPATGKVYRLRRHRLFESNVELLAEPCSCDSTPVAGVYGGGASSRSRAAGDGRGGKTPDTSLRAELMGIDWMSRRQLSQAIPPGYTQWLGEQLLDRL